MTYEAANDQSKPCLVVVLASGDNIPLLGSAAVTSGRLDGGEVLPEVARRRIDEQAGTG